MLEDVFVDTCEAFIDPERLRKKYELYVKLTFLKFDNAPNNEEASKLKVLSIHKLKNIFNSNPNEYTLLLNKMSEDENKRFFNQPQFHTNYLNLYNTLTSNENKQKYKIISSGLDGALQEWELVLENLKNINFTEFKLIKNFKF